MTPIPEIEEEKTIIRMRRLRNGQRVQEKFTYLQGFDPTCHYGLRTGAKIIDVAFYVIITIVFFRFSNLGLEIAFFEIFLSTGLVYLLLNSILEWRFAKSIGKYFFRIEIINNFNEKPNFKQTIIRNFITAFILFSIVGFFISYFIPGNDFHSKFSETYIVKTKDKPEITRKIYGITMIKDN
jgi:uncharacterized RDD family membrane protein YckC